MGEKLISVLDRIAVALEESTKIKRDYADKMKAAESQRSNASQGSPSGTSAGLATPKQVKYITDLSKKLGIYTGDLSKLTVPEASAKIEELKAKIWGGKR